MVWPYGWFDYYMYQDLIMSKKVIPYPLKKPYKLQLINFIRRVHQSHKLNKIVKLPYGDIWYSSLFKLIAPDTCIIFDTGALSMVSLKFLKKIKSTGINTKMIVIVVDSLHGSSEHIPLAMPNIFGFPWDAIFSYDKNDCKEFGFHYLGPTIYSKLEGIQEGKTESDLYFVGRNKAGRNNFVIQLYKRCMDIGIKTNFELVDGSKNSDVMNLEYQDGLTFYDKDLPYENVVSSVLSTNCILEVVAKGQLVQTARYYEAVCYNKKLLTNNPNIKELPFYDSRYMKSFETIEDIDFEWVKKKEVINYHYKGEFSPNHILEKLDRMCSNKNIE